MAKSGKDNIQVSLGVNGMQRDNFEHLIDDKTYTYARNAHLETEDGSVGLTNEPSNFLCTRFKPGYVVIGTKYDSVRERVILFLTEKEPTLKPNGKTYRASEIGYINHSFGGFNQVDDITDCDECNPESVLAERLEYMEQNPACVYKTIIEDSCSGCLNFNPNFPMRGVVIKKEACGETITFTDNLNPPRYIVLNEDGGAHADYFKVGARKSCNATDDRENTCVDCDKLRIFPLYKAPCLEPKVIQNGGNLRRGIYEFLIAYCDQLGNELSPYYSLTYPISIFDTHNNIMDQTMLANKTTQGIRIEVKDIDTKFNFYKIAVIENADVNEISTPVIEGIHNITDTSVSYTTNSTERTTMQHLYANKVNYKTWGGLVAANNYLMGYDYTVENEWNLQPIANLLGAFVRWQTVQMDEDAFKDGINASKYSGFMRDEVYPLGIRFHTDEGYITPVFPLISRPANAEDLKNVSSTASARSLNATSECKVSDRKKKWQVFNTAEVIDTPPCVTEFNSTLNIEYENVTRKFEQKCFAEKIARVGAGTIKVPIAAEGDEFTDIQTWLDDPTNKDIIEQAKNHDCENNPDEVLCSIKTFLDIINNPYSDLHCKDEGIKTPYPQSEGDTPIPGTCTIPTLKKSTVRIGHINVDKDVVDYELEKRPFEEYVVKDVSADNEELDLYARDDKGRPEKLKMKLTPCLGDSLVGKEAIEFDLFFGEVYNKELGDNNNTTFAKAKALVEGENTPVIFPNMYTENMEDLVSPYNSVGNGGNLNVAFWQSEYMCKQYSHIGVPTPTFLDKVYVAAKWFKYIFKANEDHIVVELSLPSWDFEKDLFNDVSKQVRVSIFDGAKNNYTPWQVFEYDYTQGKLLKLNKSDFPSGKVYIALDTPIVSHIYMHPAPDFKCRKLDGLPPFKECNPMFHTRISTTLHNFFEIRIRPQEYKYAKINYSEVTFDKEETYEFNCTFAVPNVNPCDGSAYKYGKFGYWESTREYPPNHDLYNSSNLDPKKVLDSIKDVNLQHEFSEYYLDSNKRWKRDKNGKELVNFTCRPIRHFKFPSNQVSPFMSSTADAISGAMANATIYPLGVTIDPAIINGLLDAAVKNNLITQKQRDSIYKFELFRGDRSLHKSILSKGIANNFLQDNINSNDGVTTLVRNFPYNNLGDNAFVSGLTPAKSSNNTFSIISPELYSGDINRATEFALEGYMFGNSLGGFQKVEGHPEWVITTSKARKWAATLATGEIAFEELIETARNQIIANSNRVTINQRVVNRAAISSGGVLNTTGILNVVKGGVWNTVLNLLQRISGVFQKFIFKYPKLYSQWMDIFEGHGSPTNFAYMYVSTKGWYNSFKFLDKQQEVRSARTFKRIKPGLLEFRDGVNTIRINNRDRESHYYISSAIGLTYPSEYSNYDSRTGSNKHFTSCYRAGEVTDAGNFKVGSKHLRNIASPYMSLRVYLPDQYGDIDGVRWLSMNHCGHLDDNYTCRSIFGGDIKISRIDLKNKYPMYLVNALNLANSVAFDYNLYPNAGVPIYNIGYKSEDHDLPKIAGSNYIHSKYRTDLQTEKGLYLRSPSMIYLYVYGVPYFLVESEINCNFRYAGREPHEQFASNGINVEDWVQEKRVSIAHNNHFFYNPVYSRSQTGLSYKTLPSVYDKDKAACLSIGRNSMTYSMQDNSEISLNDPWLVFKPFNIHQFRTDYGKLISMSSIESQQVLVRFENNMAMFNAVDPLRDRVNPQSEELGLAGMFQTRPVEFSHTELGETGTQHRAIVSCEFGHFWVDAKRGKIFHLQPNGSGLTAISDFGNNGESGMRKWFKKHLPFKILKSGKIKNLEYDHLDNHYKGLGILMWWDSKFKRVFITKRDYIPLVDGIEYHGGEFYKDSVKIELTDRKFFKDVSWTIAYSPIYRTFVSFYDYKPDYAISYNDYFQTGINYSRNEKELGIWTHVMTNKSYQVFYGNYYPFEIEVPIKNTFTNSIFQDASLWTVTQRYHNDYDFAQWRNKSFNKAIVYNNTNNSGNLHLHYVDSHRKADYPKLLSNTEQAITATHIDEAINFNYVYNRVRKEDAHLPIWNWDSNEITKTLNDKAISFTSKRTLERMRGDWFLVRLTEDHDSRFKQIFKWMVTSSKPYN